MVVVLDRPRHEEGIEAIREAGGRVRLITDGDVVGGAARGRPRPAGRPAVGHRRHARGRDLRRRAEVLSAAALIGRLWPRDDDERKAAVDAGYDLDRVLTQDDLVKGDNCFFSATGVTDGDVLEGVRYEGARGRDARSRWSCAAARAPCGGSSRATTATKLRALTGYRYG